MKELLPTSIVNCFSLLYNLSESESYSVVSDSLRPHGLYIHGIL